MLQEQQRAGAPALASDSAPIAEQAPPAAQTGPFSSLRYANYRYLWTGTLCMSMGQWIQQVTLGWVVYDLTGSAVLLGLLGAIRAIPFLLVSPVAGVVVDRMDRRRLMLQLQVIFTITAFSMGLLVASGYLQAWHIFVFSLITASAWSVNQTVRQTLVTMAVPREAVSNAVALNSVGFNINKVLGPTIGGFLIAWFGAAGNFFVQSVAYLGVLISIGLMQVPPADQSARKESVWANLKDGFRYVRGTPAVFALLIAAFVPSVIAMPYLTLMPVIQKDVLHLGPDALGLMLAAPGVGAVIFTLGLATFSSRVKRKGLILLAAMASLGVCLVLFSRTTTLPMALLALVGIGGSQILYNAVNMTMLQLLVPEGLMGRVMSIYLLNVGFSPAGALFAGASTAAIGAPTTVAIMGSTVVVLAIVMFFRNPELRRIET